MTQMLKPAVLRVLLTLGLVPRLRDASVVKMDLRHPEGALPFHFAVEAVAVV